MQQPSPKRRRWFQFSLRSLLLLMLAACVLIAWYASSKRHYTLKRQALDQVVKLGGRYGAVAKKPGWIAWIIGSDYVDVRSITFEPMNPSGPVDDPSRSVSDDDLSVLRRFPELQRLSLHGNIFVTDKGAAHLAELVNLRRLSLHNTRVTDVGLTHLLEMTKLEVLSLQNTLVTERGIQRLMGLANLRDLNLSSTKVRGRLQVAGLPRLETLNLDNAIRGRTDNEIDAASEFHITDCPNLKTLRIGYTFPARVRLVRLPKLKSVQVNSVDYRHMPCIVEIEDLPALTSLDLSCRSFHIQRLRGVPMLRSITAPLIIYKKDELAALARCPRLESLDLSGSQIELLTLGRWTNLRRLSLAGTNIGDDTLRGLSQLTGLTQLDLSSTRITDQGLRHLRHLQGLASLKLDYTQISDAGLRKLIELKKLVELTLFRTKTSQAGVAKLDKSLPAALKAILPTGLDYDSGYVDGQ